MAEPAGLAQEQRSALDRLSRSGAAGEYYLAGGSAVVLHCGHRRSLDLDFFSIAPDADPALPAGMTPVLWEKLKAFFREETPRLVTSRT